MDALERVPKLRLVPSGSVRFHEHPERNRTLRLVERLHEEKRLRNPPIVARLDATSYVLLDGANRVSALEELRFSHLPVQVIEYGNPAIRLKGWHHLLLEGRALELQASYAKLPGVRIEPVAHSDLTRLLELRQLYAVLVDEKTNCWGLLPRDGTIALNAWMGVLNDVIEAYEGKTRLERIKLADFSDLPEVFRTIDHQLLLFPRLSKTELLKLVQDGVMIPTGITRHLIPGRALGLNLELEFLRELPTEQEKIAHFRAFVDELEMQGRIRYYEESAFIMNE